MELVTQAAVPVTGRVFIQEGSGVLINWIIWILRWYVLRLLRYSRIHSNKIQRYVTSTLTDRR
jgi:hypothetical protein